MVLMNKSGYGSSNGRYGRVDCAYCDSKDIKREHIGNHLYKCHKDKLRENFASYLNTPDWNQPFVNTTNKTYSYCFVCHQCHSTTNGSASKPAIKHMTGNCSYENQYNQLKVLFGNSSPDIITIPVPVTPTYKTHISNNADNSIYEEKLSLIMAEMAELKKQISELRKPANIVQEISEVCTDCKEWGDAFSDKIKEVDELKEKLGIN